MAALIQWREPRSVSDWELKHEGVPEFKNLFRAFWKWSLIIGLPVLVVTWHWLPQGFWPVLRRLLICCTALPAFFVFSVWVNSKTGTFYFIDRKGLVKATSRSGDRYNWNDIKSFHFSPHPQVPNMRCLVVNIQRGKRQYERNFHFSPDEISEEKLRDLLQEYLPQIS